MEARGVDYNDFGLVFPRPDGRPMKGGYLGVRFQAVSQRAGLPRIRFHDLRHSFATLALEAGVPPKAVSDTLGHASVAFTMDQYAHAIPNVVDEMAERMAAMLNLDGDPEQDHGGHDRDHVRDRDGDHADEDDDGQGNEDRGDHDDDGRDDDHGGSRRGGGGPRPAGGGGAIGSDQSVTKFATELVGAR